MKCEAYFSRRSKFTRHRFGGPKWVRRRLNKPEAIVLGREMRSKALCPSGKFPEGAPRPKVEVLTLALEIELTLGLELLSEL